MVGTPRCSVRSAQRADPVSGFKGGRETVRLFSTADESHQTPEQPRRIFLRKLMFPDA
jgi:hypothetical protein